jgi:hypothetical protein
VRSRDDARLPASGDASASWIAPSRQYLNGDGHALRLLQRPTALGTQVGHRARSEKCR